MRPQKPFAAAETNTEPPPSKPFLPLLLDGTRIQLSRFQKTKTKNVKESIPHVKRLRILNTPVAENKTNASGTASSGVDPPNPVPPVPNAREQLKPALVVCCEEIFSERVKRLKETLQGIEEQDFIRFLATPGGKFNPLPAHDGTGSRKCKKDCSRSDVETQYITDTYTEFFGQHYQFLNRLIEEETLVNISH